MIKFIQYPILDCFCIIGRTASGWCWAVYRDGRLRKITIGVAREISQWSKIKVIAHEMIHAFIHLLLPLSIKSKANLNSWVDSWHGATTYVVDEEYYKIKAELTSSAC